MPNDDLWMHTRGWPGAFMSALASSPVLPNLGVTGPWDRVSGQAGREEWVGTARGRSTDAVSEAEPQ